MTFENPVGRLTLVWNTLHQAHIKGDAVPLDDLRRRRPQQRAIQCQPHTNLYSIGSERREAYGALNAAEREADRLPTTTPSSVERKSKQTISVVQTAHRVPRLRRLLNKVVDGVAEVRRLAEVGVCVTAKQNTEQNANKVGCTKGASLEMAQECA